jgi:uncharacterized membrane protein
MLPTTEIEQNQITSSASSTQQVSGTYAPLPDEEHDGLVTAHAVQTIRAEQLALYNLWRDVSRIPLWQEHVVSITRLTDQQSHWVMGNPEDPDGKRLGFDSEIYEDVPGSRIAWRSILGDVVQSGSVTFEPAVSGRGTLVTLVETIKIPSGALGNAAAAIAKRSPRQTVIENLRHFKQLAETGEIPSVKGQPHGPRGISGGIKEWLYGETNPTPPGTSETIK